MDGSFCMKQKRFDVKKGCASNQCAMLIEALFYSRKEGKKTFNCLENTSDKKDQKLI